jgi:plastocyanin
MKPTPITLIALLISMLASKAGAAEGQDKKSEIAELRSEVQELKTLMIRLLEVEEMRLSAIHQLVRDMKEGRAPVAVESKEPAPKADEPKTTPPRPGETGVISGKVTITKASGAPAFVYVRDVSERIARNKTEEIQQIDKQFVPQVIAVQRGTRVSFPNKDNIFHNVFSLTQGNAFDLGSYRSGDKPASYVFTEPGVVEIFCNLHSQMNASVLVVPNHYFAKVGSDGRYQIPGVPKGKHSLVAWTPNVPPMVKPVVVRGGQDASVDFTIEGVEGAPKHTDKFGMPYGSYQGQ